MQERERIKRGGEEEGKGGKKYHYKLRLSSMNYLESILFVQTSHQYENYVVITMPFL